MGYFLKIPIAPNKILLAFPNKILLAFPSFKINNMRVRSIYLIKYLTKIHSICKLFYSAFSNKEAPIWPIIFKSFNKQKTLPKKDPIKKLEIFYQEQQKLVKAFKEVDRTKVRQSLKEVTYWNFIGTLFRNHNYTRGEKDVLISMLTDLSRAAMEAGLSVKRAVCLLDELIQKVECQSSIPLFNLYMQGLIWRYFRELKYFRQDHQLPLAEQCMRYIKNGISKSITIADLCDHFNCSKSTLCRTFKKKYNKTINTTIRELKISAAQKLLITTKYSIKEIYSQLGFNNASYFYRIFKAELNITPQEYSQKFQG